MFKWLGKIFGGGKSPFEAIADTVDRFVDTKEEKREFLEKAWEMHKEDRDSARNLYGKDSTVQKVYAITFLLGYLALTGWLVYAIKTGSIKDVTQFETGMIGTIWGAMSAKVNTVVDFFFGAAEAKEDKNYDHLIGKK